jgi:hypothetical protein
MTHSPPKKRLEFGRCFSGHVTERLRAFANAGRLETSKLTALQCQVEASQTTGLCWALRLVPIAVESGLFCRGKSMKHLWTIRENAREQCSKMLNSIKTKWTWFLLVRNPCAKGRANGACAVNFWKGACENLSEEPCWDLDRFGAFLFPRCKSEAGLELVVK